MNVFQKETDQITKKIYTLTAALEAVERDEMVFRRIAKEIPDVKAYYLKYGIVFRAESVNTNWDEISFGGSCRGTHARGIKIAHGIRVQGTITVHIGTTRYHDYEEDPTWDESYKWEKEAETAFGTKAVPIIQTYIKEHHKWRDEEEID